MNNFFLLQFLSSVVISILGLLCLIGTFFEALQDCLTPDNLVPPKSLYSNQNFDHDPEDGMQQQRVVNDSDGLESNKDDFNYSRFGTDSQPPVKMTRGW